MYAGAGGAAMPPQSVHMQAPSQSVPCDCCGNKEAMLYCLQDRARLCPDCDRQVHSANSLAERHTRTWICSSCRGAPAEVLCLHDGAALCRSCDAGVHGAAHASHHKRQPLPPLMPMAPHAPLMGRPGGIGDPIFDAFIETLDGSVRVAGGADGTLGGSAHAGKAGGRQPGGRAAASSGSSGEANSALDAARFFGMPAAGPHPSMAHEAPLQQPPPKKPKRRGRPRKEEVAARAAARAAAQASLAKQYAFEQEIKRWEAHKLRMMRDHGVGFNHDGSRIPPPNPGSGGHPGPVPGRGGTSVPGPLSTSTVGGEAEAGPGPGAGSGPGGGSGPGPGTGAGPRAEQRPGSGPGPGQHIPPSDTFGTDGAPSLKLNSIQEGVVIRHEGGRYEWVDSAVVNPLPVSGSFGEGVTLAEPGSQRIPNAGLSDPTSCAANRASAIARYKEKRLKRKYSNNLRYANRKEMADQRVRNKGRFVKKGKD